MSKRVAVIGSGLGGLSAAIHLARAGHSIDLFEKNSAPGGKMNLYEVGGYRFDTGPSLLTMPDVLLELFDQPSISALPIDIEPVDPLCRYFYKDGSVLDAFGDRPRFLAELERFSPGSSVEYIKFMEYTRKIYNTAAPVFLFEPIHEIKRILKLKHLNSLFHVSRIDAFRTVHKTVSGAFSDPRLIQLFDRYPTYNGSDPYQAPATLNIIPYVEFELGGFYISGGMYGLVEALVKEAVGLGVNIKLNSPVDSIINDGFRVSGVRVAGDIYDYDAVVCNGDVVDSYNRLLPGFNKTKAKLNDLEPSVSGMVFLWGVNANHKQLAQHNIFFSGDYQHEFKQIFQDQTPPDDPTIYIAITSKADSSHAPPGCENWFVLLNMPYLTEDQDWESATNRLRQAVFEKLKNNDLDIASSIQHEHIFTPQTLQERYWSNRGSIYGLSSNDRNAAFRRPPNRNRDLRGLYFAGGSTHPGGGIPLCLLSGKMAAELAQEYDLS